MRQFSWILAVFLFMVVGGCGGESADTPKPDDPGDPASTELTDEEMDGEKSLE